MKWIVLLMFGSIGAVMFIAGSVWGFKRWSLMRRGVEAVGVIVDSKESVSTESDSRGRAIGVSHAFHPVVQYSTPDGRRLSVTGTTGSGGSADFSLGDHVKVYYDPESPEDSVIATFSQAWLGPLGVGLFGFLFLVAGIGGFFLIQSSDDDMARAQERMGFPQAPFK